jgi:hypothetical protein
MFEVAGSISISKVIQSDGGLGYDEIGVIGLNFEEVAGPIA